MLNIAVKKEMPFTELEVLFVRMQWEELKHSDPTSRVGVIVNYLREMGQVLHTSTEVIYHLELTPCDEGYAHPVTGDIYNFYTNEISVCSADLLAGYAILTYPFLLPSLHTHSLLMYELDNPITPTKFWVVPGETVGLLTSTVDLTDYRVMPITDERIAMVPELQRPDPQPIEKYFIATISPNFMDEENFGGDEHLDALNTYMLLHEGFVDWDSYDVRLNGKQMWTDDTCTVLKSLEVSISVRGTDSIISYTVDLTPTGEWIPSTFKYEYHNLCTAGVIPPKGK